MLHFLLLLRLLSMLFFLSLSTAGASRTDDNATIAVHYQYQCHCFPLKDCAAYQKGQWNNSRPLTTYLDHSNSYAHGQILFTDNDDDQHGDINRDA